MTDTTPEPPRFQHDCDSCKYLGRWEHFDLYFCLRPDKRIAIARYGSEMEQINWDSLYSVKHPEIAEAKRRAIVAGLLPADEPTPSERLKTLSHNGRIKNCETCGAEVVSAQGLPGMLPKWLEACGDIHTRLAVGCEREPTPSEMITIAHVAAKLRMAGGDAHAHNTRCPAGWMFLYKAGEYKGWVEVKDGWDGLTVGMMNPRELCELAGVPYERYEAREPEQAAEPSRDWLDTSVQAYERGLEAGRSESMQANAALLEACEWLWKNFEPPLGTTTEELDTVIATIAQAKAAQGKGGG